MKYSIMLPDNMYLKLEKIATDLGVAVSAIVKIAISRYIKEEENDKKRD